MQKKFKFSMQNSATCNSLSTPFAIAAQYVGCPKEQQNIGPTIITFHYWNKLLVMFQQMLMVLLQVKSLVHPKTWKVFLITMFPYHQKGIKFIQQLLKPENQRSQKHAWKLVQEVQIKASSQGGKKSFYNSNFFCQ